MKKKCIEKHPKDMTTDEAIACTFHPDALKHLKKHVAAIQTKKKKPRKTDDK